MNKIFRAMTIAGSDTSGGAGLQADIKTLQELGVYGMTALTVVVTQDPDNDWTHEVYPINLSIVFKQIETIVKGIGIDAMKTGMLGSAELVDMVADRIDWYRLKNIVIDPVMFCKGVDTILVPESAEATRELLVSRATVITPNILEAAYLAGKESITSLDEMKDAAALIHGFGAENVVIKGSAAIDPTKSIDLFYDGKEFVLLENETLHNVYTHGAGCTYSAAITAFLARGYSVLDAVCKANRFVHLAIKHSFPLNKFVGPTNHAAHRQFATK